MDPIEIIREPERFRMTGVSRVQWWRLEREGMAPQRVRLGPNSVGWLRCEINAWQMARIAERNERARPSPAPLPVTTRLRADIEADIARLEERAARLDPCEVNLPRHAALVLRIEDLKAKLAALPAECAP